MALAEADYSLTEMAMNTGVGAPGDETLLVKFFLEPVQNKERSNEEGRPIFEEREFVSIMVPGQKDNIVIREARETDKDRFPRHYAAFKNRVEQVVDGTPLEEWPAVTRSQVEELKFFNVFTVEQLAEISDSNAQNFMGIQLLRQKAKAFLEAANDVGAMADKLSAEIEKRDVEIAALQEALADQAKLLKELTGDAVPNSGGHDKPSRRRGRPRTRE